MCGRWPVRIACRSCVRDTQRHRNRMERAGHVQTGAKGPAITTNKIRHYVQDSECNEVAGRRRAFGIRASLLEVLARGAYKVRTGAAALIVQRRAQHVRGERLREKLEPGTARQKASDSRSHCSQHDEAMKGMKQANQ